MRDKWLLAACAAYFIASLFFGDKPVTEGDGGAGPSPASATASNP
jgi:hypothetical protein